MNFSAVKRRNKSPSATLVVPLSAFADAWSGKPSEPICVGLRLLSNEDRQKARKVAEEMATELHPRGGDGWIECYNDAVRRQAVALALCDPNDVTQPSQAFPYAEDTVLVALTASGTQKIFDAVEQHEIDQSPLERAADQATLLRLARLLERVDFALMNGRLSRRVSAMLEEIEALVDDDLVDDPRVDDSREEGAVVVGKQGVIRGRVGAR